MRYIFYIFILGVFCHCKPEKNNETGIIEYLKWDNDTNYNYREFQSYTDSTLTKIFISQQWKQVDDSTWQFEYAWKNVDSLPINRSIERYTKNKVELVAQYIYEMDSAKNAHEVSFNVENNNPCFINSQGCSFDGKAKFVIDSSFTMTVHTDIKYDFRMIETFPESERDCLVVTSSDRISFDFTDSRRDTVINSIGTRIYSKGLGLVYFSDNDGENNYEFKLKK